MAGNWTIDDSGNIRETSASDPNRILFGLQVLQADFTISSAEMLALDATEKVLVAAPGANKALSLVSLSIRQRYGSATYTNAGTIDVALGTIGGTPVNLTDAAAAAILKTATTAAADSAAVVVGAGGGNALADVNNQPMMLYSTGAVAVGDGTFSGSVSYVVVDIAVPAVP
jgi:hypothetical protein